MEELCKEEKTVIKHGWLTKSPDKRIQRWKERYFEFCEITSGNKRWLRLYYYKHYAAFKAREMAINFIDITEASDIGIGQAEVNGHRHIIVIKVPGRLHYLSASSCEDMFQWNLALRSRKFDDSSTIQSPSRKANSWAGIYQDRQRYATYSTNEYSQAPTAMTEPTNAQRDRSMSDGYSSPNVPMRSDIDVIKSNLKLRKQFLYCKSCLKKIDDTVYENINNIPTIPENMPGTETEKTTEEEEPEPIYVDMEQYRGDEDEIYEDPYSEPYELPNGPNPPKLPAKHTTHVYDNVSRNQGTEHEEHNSVSLEDLYARAEYSKSLENNGLGTRNVRNLSNKSHNPVCFSTVSLPGIYITQGSYPNKSRAAQEIKPEFIPRASSTSSGVYDIMDVAEPRRNTDGQIGKGAKLRSFCEKNKTPLTKTSSVPVNPASGKLLSNLIREGKKSSSSSNILTDHSTTCHERSNSLGSVTCPCVQESEDDTSSKKGLSMLTMSLTKDMSLSKHTSNSSKHTFASSSKDASNSSSSKEASNSSSSKGASTSSSSKDASTSPSSKDASTSSLSKDASTSSSSKGPSASSLSKDASTSSSSKGPSASSSSKDASTSSSSKEASTSPSSKDASTSPSPKDASTSSLCKEASTSSLSKEASTSPSSKDASNSQILTTVSSSSKNGSRSSVKQVSTESLEKENSKQTDCINNNFVALMADKAKEFVITRV